MIPVVPAPEPADFDDLVRTPGSDWLHAKGWAGLAAPPPKAKIRPYWRQCLPHLLAAYDRICSYTSLRIPAVVGAPSADHFAPKSRALALTYEWTNYRLACGKVNGRKRDYTNLLDPFTLAPDTFHLNTLNGAIYPNPALARGQKTDARRTSKRLKLDDPEMRAARLHLITSYLDNDISANHLRRESPFIWLEMRRQNQL